MSEVSERRKTVKKKQEEEIDDYLSEVVEARMEQAELRFKSSKYWIFKDENREEELVSETQ